MRKSQNDTIENEKLNFVITKEGSLGLLAYGDIGLREWRKVKQSYFKKSSK